MNPCSVKGGVHFHPELRGSILNVSEENFTPEGLVYGVLEGMAAELYEMFRVIQEETGIQAERLIASGNGLRRKMCIRDSYMSNGRCWKSCQKSLFIPFDTGCFESQFFSSFCKTEQRSALSVSTCQ